MTKKRAPSKRSRKGTGTGVRKLGKRSGSTKRDNPRTLTGGRVAKRASVVPNTDGNRELIIAPPRLPEGRAGAPRANDEEEFFSREYVHPRIRGYYRGKWEWRRWDRDAVSRIEVDDPWEPLFARLVMIHAKYSDASIEDIGYFLDVLQERIGNLTRLGADAWEYVPNAVLVKTYRDKKWTPQWHKKPPQLASSRVTLLGPIGKDKNQ